MFKSSKLGTVSLIAALSVCGAIAMAAVGVDSGALRNAVGIVGLKKHLTELQLIASGNGGNRAAGTVGHGASANYIKAQLTAAGYSVQSLPFDFKVFSEISAPSFARTAPTAQAYVEFSDFLTMEYSGSGNVNAVVQNAGGIVIPPTADASSTSGCTAVDFAGFQAGSVALVQRGGCTFAEKAVNAHAAGASAVIIFNEGNANDPSRIELFGGTLGEDFDKPIPVLSASFAVGAALAGLNGAVVAIKTNTQTEVKQTVNILAETATGRSDRVVVVGAHLDSVAEGAGINDNGSGSAAILEVARQMSKLKIKPINKVRFMWFSAEEAGLIGSQHYVDSLAARDKKNIALMLNFDMVASPNFVRFVYDGDGSATADAGPNGSATIENVFAKYWNSKTLPFEATAFDGRSDYGPFIDAGIPAGGLFTGAEEAKTAAQVAVYGGVAGDQLDECYHAACDDIDNINDLVFEQMADATADAVLQFAMTTSAVKGTSKANDQAVKSVSSESRLHKGRHLQR